MDMPLFAVSISGILSGAAVGVVTVFIAAHSPAKQAARVSPVAAVSGNANVSKKVSRITKIRFFKVETSLGIHHATGAKKKSSAYYRFLCPYDRPVSCIFRLP